MVLLGQKMSQHFKISVTTCELEVMVMKYSNKNIWYFRKYIDDECVIIIHFNYDLGKKVNYYCFHKIVAKYSKLFFSVSYCYELNYVPPKKVFWSPNAQM